MKKLLLALLFILIPINVLFASDNETEKIQWHLDRVETILRKVDTSFLIPEQKTNRLKMLDRLHLYTEAGKFPNNDTFIGKSVPFFRGSNGNLCAVGYLMDGDIEYKSFIENIVKTNNNVSLMDISDNTILQYWLQKYGFTLLEAAMIQPTYGVHTLKGCTFMPPGDFGGYKYSYQYWCGDVIIGYIGYFGIVLGISLFILMLFVIFKKNKIGFQKLCQYTGIIFAIFIIILELIRQLVNYFLGN